MNRRTLLVLSGSSLSAGGAGCTDVDTLGGDDGRTDSSDEIGSDDEKHSETDGDDAGHDLLVLADGRSDGKNIHAGTTVTSYGYDEKNDAFQRSGRYRIDEIEARLINSVDVIDDGCVISRGSRSVAVPDADRSIITVLDSEMTVRETADVEGLYTLTSDGEYIYAASEIGFTVFDAELNTVGRTALEDEFGNKHMEDVVVHDGVAYIVDNVVKPMLLFRVDVSDPSNPEYLEVVAVLGTNQSLGQQAIDPDANRWLCLQTTGGRAGSSQNVLVTPMEGAESDGDEDIDIRARDEIESETVYEYDRESDSSEGTYVEDITAQPPLYASVTVDESHYLSSVTIDDGEDGVTFGLEIELDSSARVDILDGRVVALSKDMDGGRLIVYDPETDERSVDQELDGDLPLEIQARGP
ncbi:LVIVD repeat-containing protein [Natronococcus wangiae]|uniref:hypothetical protein n=1 Tax=Natronococcus wangiae TaxID=3068275 RepID=UPI00273D469C|nr:hypothetical protein [Natronococcus sp. AD5]